MMRDYLPLSHPGYYSPSTCTSPVIHTSSNLDTSSVLHPGIYMFFESYNRPVLINSWPVSKWPIVTNLTILPF